MYNSKKRWSNQCVRMKCMKEKKNLDWWGHEHDKKNTFLMMKFIEKKIVWHWNIQRMLALGAEWMIQSFSFSPKLS